MSDEAPKETTAAAPKASKRSRRKLWITLGVLGVLAAIVIGFALYLAAPAQPKDYEPLVSEESKERNQLLYTALVAAGISSPFVDATGERVLIVYELPDPDNVTDKDGTLANLQRLALSAAYTVAPDVGYYTIIGNVKQEAKLLWEADASDMKDFREGRLTTSEFEAKVRKESFA